MKHNFFSNRCKYKEIQEKFQSFDDLKFLINEYNFLSFNGNFGIFCLLLYILLAEACNQNYVIFGLIGKNLISNLINIIILSLIFSSLYISYQICNKSYKIYRFKDFKTSIWSPEFDKLSYIIWFSPVHIFMIHLSGRKCTIFCVIIFSFLMKILTDNLILREKLMRGIYVLAEEERINQQFLSKLSYNQKMICIR